MEQMELFSDEALAIFVPIVVYWLYSALYLVLGKSMDKYRLHSRLEEDSKNLVSKRDVITGVLLQQLVQASLATIVMLVCCTVTYYNMSVQVTGDRSSGSSAEAVSSMKQTTSSYLILAWQFVVGMVVLDGWQYMWHRYLHQNRFLYRHIHSWHHRLVVPYPYGTLYNHPAEGLLLDTMGGLLAFVVSGMSPRASIYFFSFCTVKAIDDHCGMMLPWNVFHRCFWNNTAYHDLHHQVRGGKYNFSQPFFVTWDKVFGTHMPYVVEARPEGGIQARPQKATVSCSDKQN
ncbi:hypothetical protein PR202_ga17013 [Eleusine coracana subsp. coracana]|uniref:aldehyde oxygenase (deformylating) n=1 Tax=Eleusine coracana subsp. coracana TaxID=191504 RepID=A0AAV5CPR7_ELECO|nr:hypothetical protein PR202_ga17013 [Eleusine coracana subsp. coracana]